MRLKTLLITLVAVFMAVAACATVSTNAGRNEYTAGAAQTIFNYTFKIYADTDLSVYLTPVGQEPDDSADLTTAYTVAGAGDDAGGSITLNSGTTSGDLVTIVSTIPTNRTIDYQFNGDFRPNVVNNDFDRAVSLVKQLENTSINTLKYQDSLQGGAGTLPDPVAGNVIGYDGLAQLTNLDLGVDGNSWDGLADLGDNSPGKGSDLVAHTGTADTVTEAIDKKVALAGDTMTGGLILDDGTVSSPRVTFREISGDTSYAFFELANENNFRLKTAHQGGSEIMPINVVMSTGELQALGNRVLTTVDIVTASGATASGGPVSLPDNALTAIAFVSEEYDDDDFHDNVTNNTRLTVPAGVSRIRLWGSLAFVQNATGYRSISIFKNGADDTTSSTPKSTALPVNSPTGTHILLTSAVLEVSPADYFELMGYQNSGGVLSLLSSNTFFSIEVVE